MLVSADLDGGAIEIVSASDQRRIELRLRPDRRAEFMQWFHFELRARPGRPVEIRIANASEATYADAWEGYSAAASYDGSRWFRVPTEYDGEALIIRHTPARDLVLYAYFAPYPLARRERLLNRATRSPRARVDVLGETPEERPVCRVIFGEPAPDRRRVWIIARQHPGETMAEWLAEGVAERLLDLRSDLAAVLLERAVVSLVPCVNPDGAVLGNLRTNALGVDLNRAWIDPGDDAPEVIAVRRAMLDEGVDLLLDVHGDEHAERSFAAGCEGNPSWGPRLAALEERFVARLNELDPAFATENAYAGDPPEPRAAANWAGETFDCLSLTLEMPFRDLGFTPRRAARLGVHALESVLACLDELR